MQRDFEIVDRFHLGTYDYLTRVVYPLAAGETEVRHNTVISERFAELARHSNVDDFEHLSRIRGLVCRRRP